MEENSNRIDLIIPVFNPPENWISGIRENVLELEKLTQCTIHATIVCDGGLAFINTTELDALETTLNNCRVIKYDQNAGKGHAIREGLKAVSGNTVMYTDVDFPYTSDSFLRIYESLQSGADVAAGTRSDAYYKHVPWLRRIVSKFLRRLIRIIVRIPISDTQCGLKGFNAKGAEVFAKTEIDRFLFDLEFIKLCAKKKLSIAPVSVQLKPGIVFSKTRLAILIRESINFLKIMFR